MKTSIQKKTVTKRKSRCLALIPLDTKKIIPEQMKVYNRCKKVLERLEVQIAIIVEKDEPEYQKFLARKFGAERTRQREIQSEIFMNQTRFKKIRFMASEKGMKPDRYCYVLSQNVTGKQQLSDLKNKFDKVLHGWEPKIKMGRKNQKESPNETLKQMELFPDF